MVAAVDVTVAAVDENTAGAGGEAVDLGDVGNGLKEKDLTLDMQKE